MGIELTNIEASLIIESEKFRARIAELERVLAIANVAITDAGGCLYETACNVSDMCRPCKALAEIKSVLGKGE